MNMSHLFKRGEDVVPSFVLTLNMHDAGEEGHRRKLNTFRRDIFYY